MHTGKINWLTPILGIIISHHILVALGKVSYYWIGQINYSTVVEQAKTVSIIQAY